jgi:hypothetical protein
MNAHVELSREGGVLVSRMHMIASRLLRVNLVLSCYLAMITIGCMTADYFMQAVAPRFISYLFGGIAVGITSFHALIFSLFIPNQKEFLQQVVDIYWFGDFRMAIGMAVCSLVIVRPGIRILDRTLTSYASRFYACSIALCVSVAIIQVLHEYLKQNEYWPAYVFSFAIIGLVYLVLVADKSKPEVKRDRSHYDMLQNMQIPFISKESF